MSETQKLPAPAFFIARLIAYRPLRYAIVALCWILFHSWPLIPGLLAKAFFDALEGRTPAGLTLESIVALIAAAGLARAGIIFASGVAGTPWSFARESLLQRNLLARILERPGAKATPGSVGEAISIMRDDVGAMGLASDWIFDAVAGLCFAVGGLAILLWVDARVTLLVFIPIVVVVVIAHAARNQLEKAREQSRDATAQVTGSIGEIFGAVQAIQVAGAEEPVIAHLRRLGATRQRLMLRDQMRGLVLEAIFGSIANLGAGLTLLVASTEMRAGTFTVGDFALFATYLMQVAEYTGFLGYLIASYRQAHVAFRRGITLLQGAPPASLVAHHPLYLNGPLPSVVALRNQPAINTRRARSDDPHSAPLAIVRSPFITGFSPRLETLEVRGLTLRHPESGRGIEDIAFSLTRGSFTVLTGRIGAGKTTLLRALLGLLEPDAGEIRWNGILIDRPAQFLIPPRVAYTPQVPTLLSGTLRENLLLGLPDDAERLERAVRRAALDEDLAGFPTGLDTRIGARGVRLSGGQIQRVAAARMFVREPELLVFDDLSSALDVETERLLWERLSRETGAVTVLAVSHRRALLERADQILVLEQGRITARGRLAELLATNAELRRLYASLPEQEG